MNFRPLAVYFIVLACLCSSCRENGSKGVKDRKAPLPQKLIKYNQDAVAEEEMLINQYVKRHSIPVSIGRGGLRYYIYHHGNGQQVSDSATVLFAYSVYFLTGDLIYSSKVEGNREVILGKTAIETGLHDGILMMHGGDRAKFVLPSHLAFGASGDGKSIPPRTTLIYDIELIDVNQ